MKKITLFAMAALLLICTQCKKNEATESAKPLQITFSPTDNGSKTEFDPTGNFVWTGNECIFVGGSNHADCLGVLYSQNNGGTITFNGDIEQPQIGETLYFFYLGNDKDGSVIPTTLDFSNQDGENVTNFHMACGSQEYTEGLESFDATLNVLVSFAKIDLSTFKDANNAQEVVYLHGADVFSAATVNYQDGTITGSTNGYINLGRAVDDGGYYALIPQTSPSNTTVKFDSNSKTGTMNFLRGIQAAKLYCHNDGTALAPEMGELRANAGGLFSISDTKMVRIAKSNLQYTRTSTGMDWADGTWSFMENPWDCVETANVSSEYAEQTAIGLFGWGTSGNGQMSKYGAYYYPWATANTQNQDEQKYGPKGKTYNLTGEYANGDWGINNNPGGEQPSWRVLTADEWLYLFGMTTNNQDSEGHKRYQKYGRAKINEYSAHSGIILVPNDFNDPETNQNSASHEFVGGTGTQWKNPYSNYYNGLANWNKMANAGAIFLPLAGYRNGTTLSNYHNTGFYQSSSVKTTNIAYQLRFSGSSVDPAYYTYRRFIGMSVRLVMDLD